MPWWSQAAGGGSPAKVDPLSSARETYGGEAVALTCLALELAMADDDFSTQERARLTGDLQHHFDLSSAQAAELIDAATAHQAQSVETYSFTRELCASLSAEERVVVIETLWRLAYADGVLEGAEFAFMRTVPSALGVENHVSEAAKRRALAALGLA